MLSMLSALLGFDRCRSFLIRFHVFQSVLRNLRLSRNFMYTPLLRKRPGKRRGSTMVASMGRYCGTTRAAAH